MTHRITLECFPMLRSPSVLKRRVCHLHSRPDRRRVVVTGVGLVTPLGVGVPHVWGRLLEGACGISKILEPEYASLPCRVAGFVPRGSGSGELSIDKHFTKAQQRSMSVATQFTLLAAAEAIQQSQWKPSTDEELHRTGVTVGMGMINLDDVVQSGISLRDRGYSSISPHFIPRILPNMAAGFISLKYGFKGINHAVSTACATGAHSIGDAAHFIQCGKADVMISGGTEACINPLAVAGFARLRALSCAFNERPAESSRPFDEQRDGFVMSEGAGVLVLEEYAHAVRRSAPVLAEVCGYGLSSDAHHVTAPAATGDGACRSMKSALSDAQLDITDVGYVNAHATSTPLGDEAESQAIADLFGQHCSNLAVSSTKGATGHLLGAAGAVESIFAVLACHHGVLPPTINCQRPLDKWKLNYVPCVSQPWPAGHKQRVALSNSFGFGGTNTSLCFRYPV